MVRRADPLALYRQPDDLHSSSTSLMHSLYTHDLARAGVIGACSHAGPGWRGVSRASLPRLDAGPLFVAVTPQPVAGRKLSPHSRPQTVSNFAGITHTAA